MQRSSKEKIFSQEVVVQTLKIQSPANGRDKNILRFTNNLHNSKKYWFFCTSWDFCTCLLRREQCIFWSNRYWENKKVSSMTLQSVLVPFRSLCRFEGSKGFPKLKEPM